MSGRRPGGQPGHPGANLTLVESPDAVGVHRPAACPGCGHDLGAAVVLRTERRQVLDVPVPRAQVVEHQAETRGCPGCGQATTAPFPTAVLGPIQYGPGVATLAVYLNALPLFTSGRVRLIDNQRLAAQLASLERRTSPGGRDRVDHGPGGHDDLANAAAGALTLATAPNQTAPIVAPIIVEIPRIDRWSYDDAAVTYAHYMASIGR